MIGVLDTSAAVEVVLKRESSALFNDFLAEADLVIAPTLLITEQPMFFGNIRNFQTFRMISVKNRLIVLSLYQMNMLMKCSFIESHSN